MIRSCAHTQTTFPPAAQVEIAPAPAARAAGLPWAGPDADRLNARHQEGVERAVAYCFRLIGGALTWRKAIPIAAERYGVPEAEVRTAYDKAAEEASESD